MNPDDVISGRGGQSAELERFAPGLRRYARALVARESEDPRRDADALTRETLARAERAGRTPSRRIWLYTTLITLNRARVHARKSQAAAGAHKPGDQGVTDALNALPLDHREALLLVVLERFTYGEAADALGLTRSAVAARVARARVLLEEFLEQGAGARGPDERVKPRRPPYLRLIE